MAYEPVMHLTSAVDFSKFYFLLVPRIDGQLPIAATSLSSVLCVAQSNQYFHTRN